MITLVDFAKVKCPEASPKAKDFACACQQMNDVEAGWPFPCDEELQEPAAFPLFMSSWFNLIQSDSSLQARSLFFGIQIADSEEMMTVSACCS